MKVKIVAPVLEGNDKIANELKVFYAERGIFVFNVISSPGAGKTTLLEAVIDYMRKAFKIAVIVGDIEDTVDAARLSKPNVQAIQLNTKGACHLDASMIKSALKELNTDQLDMIIVENVGNLVCPSDFDLGEDLRIVILSTTEGDDKPKKYPITFFKSDVAVINKVDLIPYTNFNLDKAKRDITSINYSIKIFEVTATKQETVFPLVQFLEEKIRQKRRFKLNV